MYKTVKLVGLFVQRVDDKLKQERRIFKFACIFVTCSYFMGEPIQETLRGCAASMTWIAKSASWYINDPLKVCNIWYVNALIFLNFEPKWDEI